MTLCVAALCEDRKTIVLAADKMISQGFIQAELQVEKIASIHSDWWVMFAGSVPDIFDILDEARAKLAESEHHDILDVVPVVEECYRRKRLRLAEANYLVPRGWSIAQFQASGRSSLGDAYFQNLDNAIATYVLGLDLMVAGFDSSGVAHLFNVGNPGLAARRDIPGYHAIGNGWIGALYFMFYRAMSTSMGATESLYHVFEAQSFGYEAGGIGEETDFIVARFGCEPVRLQENSMPELAELWVQFCPQPVSGLQERLGHYLAPLERTPNLGDASP